MFERAIKDVAFIKRWGITRNLREQNVAEHSWGVAMYANDLCFLFGLDDATCLSVLRYALWHDVDEEFTGDFPGPNKREMVTDKKAWSAALDQFMDRVFHGWRKRSGQTRGVSLELIKQVVKVADWFEAATSDGCEVQMGNLCREVHWVHDRKQCLIEAEKLWLLLGRQADKEDWVFVSTLLEQRLDDARYGQSPGPVLAAEMLPALAEVVNSRNGARR